MRVWAAICWSGAVVALVVKVVGMAFVEAIVLLVGLDCDGRVIRLG